MIEPVYRHAGVTLYQGDSLTVLRELPDGAAQCCVTSPPFWGLRDYGTATWEGGDTACEHRAPSQPRRDSHGGFQPDSQRGNLPNTQATVMQYRDLCARCGARRIDQQIGLEATPADYIAHLVAVFREVRRVLTPSGTLWCEIGDSYAGAGYSNHANTGGAQRADGGKQRHTRVFRPGSDGSTEDRERKYLGAKNRNGIGPVENIPAKSLLGIPWRLAFALQADGWILRSDIIWARGNPMPESVQDRPTKAHSYVFLLSRSARYFYCAEAIAESSVSDHPSGNGYKRPEQLSRGGRGSDLPGQVTATRNARSVWSINTEPTAFAHFATMPRELARRCILAGSAPGDTVIDPFGGAMTTALVAKTLGRNCIAIDLNPAYVQMGIKRVEEPLFEQATETAPRAEQAVLW